MRNYDVIVIGAGTAGLMAAISSAENGARVLLIDKNKRVGKKLLLTGGGRCNVTNNRPVEDLIHHIPGNGKFLYSTFHQFNNLDIMAFFEENGVSLKEEDHGRMFPVTDKSKTIVDTLMAKCLALGVDFHQKEKVVKLLIKEQLLGVRTETEKFYAPCVIITTGGRTYPATGSTGDGYRFAKQAGHTVTLLYPTESPLVSNEDFILERTLQGISLRDVQLSVLDGKRVVVQHTMDLLFTHFGVSGPAALRCSAFVNQLLEKQPEVIMELDQFPERSLDSLVAELSVHSKKTAKNAWRTLLQERLLLFFLEKAEIDPETPVDQLNRDAINRFAGLLKSFQFSVYKTFPLEKSFVTGGGVSLKEIVPKTMESKLVPGLFFAGEVLDVNGYTGGYNITAAFATGHVAGQHAAEAASYTFLPSELA